jgi:restriction endonuclease S subunit
MKDSGIEWLGEVPAHWTVSRLKPFIFLNPPKKEIATFSLDTEITFVPMEAVNESGEVDISRIKPMSECVTGYTYFRDGDVLLAKITPCFENGKIALVSGLNNGIGFGSTEFHVLRAKDNLDRHYLAFIIQSDPFRKLGEASMVGAAGQKRVPESFILNFKLAIPPINEQVEIAEFLNQKISVIDNVINHLNYQLSLIQEYRQALITAAVTGQIDVREKMAVSADTIPAGKE